MSFKNEGEFKIMEQTGLRSIAKLIDKEAIFHVTDSMTIDVIVLDVSWKYGHKRVLVKPVYGDGQGWVDESRITPKLELP